ncbi:hypothetical protein M3Y99_00051900 [Aphelenchoides fujianensis]|nr:hypothetical protein M3Y99_00051900 [Aphelenchoides fujianensis]
MERIVLMSAVLLAVVFELCSAAGAFSHAQHPNREGSLRANELDNVQREMSQINEAQQYNANLDTIMQLLRERDAQEAEWRRQEEVDRENALAELSAQKRGFAYYGARGKKASPVFEQQKRLFSYSPSRG